MKLKILAASITLFFACTNDANALDLFNNINVSINDIDSAVVSGPLFDSFSTGANSAPGFSATLSLAVGDPASGGNFQISFLSDSFGVPGSVFGTTGPLSDSLLNLSPTPLQVFCGCAVTANTRYWVELSDVGNSTVGWTIPTDSSGTGVAGEFFISAGLLYADSVYPPYQMQISVNGGGGVPEPATWAMMILGIGAVGAAMRNQRSDAAMVHQGAR